MTTKTGALALECKRESESCLYTSTSFFIWLRLLQTAKVFFLITPLVLGGIAGWKLLTASELPQVKLLTAICSFFAGLLPTIYAALKMDENLAQCRRLAGDFKNLQDAFRHAALVSSRKSFKEFEEDVKPLIERLERARSESLVVPEWCFKFAQRKVRSGDYDFNVDVEAEEGPAKPPEAA